NCQIASLIADQRHDPVVEARCNDLTNFPRARRTTVFDNLHDTILVIDMKGAVLTFTNESDFFPLSILIVDLTLESFFDFAALEIEQSLRGSLYSRRANRCDSLMVDVTSQSENRGDISIDQERRKPLQPLNIRGKRLF